MLAVFHNTSKVSWVDNHFKKFQILLHKVEKLQTLEKSQGKFSLTLNQLMDRHDVIEAKVRLQDEYCIFWDSPQE